VNKSFPIGNWLQNIGIIFTAILAALLLKMFVLDAVYIPSPSMEKTLFTGDYVLVNKLIYGAKFPGRLPFPNAVIPFLQLPSLKNIRRGDIIIFELPQKDSSSLSQNLKYFVKRCVALAGDTIAIQNGDVYVNGEVLKLHLDSHPNSIDEFESTIVPKKGTTVDITKDNYLDWERLIREEGHTIKMTSTSEIIIDNKPASSYTIEINYLFVLGDNLNHSYDSRYWGFLPEENIIGKAMMVYWSLSKLNPSGGFSGFLSSIRWNRIGRFVD